MALRSGSITPTGRNTRHPGDAVRLLLATATVAVTAWLAHRVRPYRLEVNAFRLINDLPDGFAAPLEGVMQLGALAAVPVFAVVALLARRPRLARVLVLAGAAAWLLAKLLSHLVDQESPQVSLRKVTLHGAVAPGLAFPATHVAVAAAMATVAVAYLSRQNRRLVWALVGMVAVARVYVGAHFPVDVIGGAAVGWGLGSAFNLLTGTPRGLPGRRALERALTAAGFAVDSVVELPNRHPGSANFRVGLSDGSSLSAKVVSRNQPEADWLYRAWRLLAFREVEDEVAVSSPGHRVDREAYLLFASAAEGIAVPRVVMAASLGEGDAVLVSSWVDGASLAELGESEVSDATLESLWRGVAALHGLGIAHRALRASSFLIDSAGRPWLVDLGSARACAPRSEQLKDIAELVASLSIGIPPSRIARAAAPALGDEPLAGALAFLQPLALTKPTRRAVAAHPERLAGVRASLAATAGVQAPPVESAVRVAARNLVPLFGALFAVNLLLPQVGQAHATWTAVRHADWGWLAVVWAASICTYVMAAVAIQGAAGQRLALGRTTAVQVAAAFTNRLAPGGIGAMATNLRYLEAAGIARSSAVSAVGLNSAAGFIVNGAAVLTIVALLGAGSTRLHLSLADPDLPTHWVVLVGVVAGLAVIGLIRWGRLLHRRLMPVARLVGARLAATLRNPRAAGALFGGATGRTAAFAFGFVAATRAFGLDLPVVTVLAVYLGGSALAAAAPTPGGLGALEAALAAGLTAAGAPTGPAVAAVLSFRLITYWLPILPGAVSLAVLRRSGTL